MSAVSENLKKSQLFVTTRWKIVLDASDPANVAAREELVRLYWFPLYAFARAREVSPADAADAVQTFFARLFERNSFAVLTVEGGRFRDFLRTGLKHQLISQHRADNSARRRPEGGFVFPDGLDAEARLAHEPADGRSPEKLYDRLCAHSLLESARERLRREYESSGQGTLFAHLAAHLDEDTDAVPHAVTAAKLRMAPGTVRNEAVHFRRRFQAVLREAVASTLANPDRTEEELRHLIAALNT